MKAVPIIALLVLILFVSGCTQSIAIPSGEKTIRYAQESGDYSFCDRAESYQMRCIAETELEQKLQVDYDCCSPLNCNEPQCVKYRTCGSGGSDGGGCPVTEECTVSNVWLCESTGGKSDPILERGPSRARQGFCECPNGKVFLDGYGCADCTSFEQPKTREYCQKQVSYFHKVCPDE